MECKNEDNDGKTEVEDAMMTDLISFKSDHIELARQPVRHLRDYIRYKKKFKLDFLNHLRRIAKNVINGNIDLDKSEFNTLWKLREQLSYLGTVTQRPALEVMLNNKEYAQACQQISKLAESWIKEYTKTI